MAEHDHPDSGQHRSQRRIGVGDEAADRRDRHRDVVLDVVALGGLRQRDVLAQRPEGPALRDRGGDGGVADDARLERLLHQSVETVGGVLLAFGVAALQQHVPGRRFGERPARVGHVPHHQFQAVVGDQFERGQRGRQPPLGQLQQPQRGLRIGEPGDGGHLRARLREQLDRRGGDHAQRAFGTDEEVAQVVAGVVLAQPPQPVPDLAVSGHHLQPQAQVARIAEAQHLHAAGIGRQVAAYRAASLGCQAEREQAPRLGGRLLHVGEDAAGLDRHRVVAGIDRADTVQPLERQHQRPAAVVRHAAADHAGVAALRHDRHAVRRTPADDRGDIGGALRQRYGQRPAAPPLAPVDDVGLQFVVGGQQPAVEGGAQRLQIDPTRCRHLR